jgi:hypothetical protein
MFFFLFIIFIKFNIEFYLTDSIEPHEPVDRYVSNVYKTLNIFHLPQFLIVPYILMKLQINELFVGTSIVIIFGCLKIASYPDNGIFYYNLYTDLNMNVYGQESGLSHLSKLLEYPNRTLERCKYNEEPQCSTFTGLQVIVLSGGPGTGKSYIASKIKKHYSAQHIVTNIIPEITPLSERILHKSQKNILNLLSGFSLIIIDAIKPTDNYISSYLKQLSIFTERYEVDVIVILVVKTINVLSYNDIIGVDRFQNKIEYYDYMKLLTDNFVNEVLRPISNINYNVILLEALSINEVKECMQVNDKSEMGTKYKWNSVLQNSRDRDFVLSGCKAVL